MRSYKIVLIILCWFIISDNTAFAQMQKFRISNFNQRDYGSLQEAQNLSVVQDQMGLLYFGNANGVLEYDGVNWRFIRVGNGIYVSSLACDAHNTIFLGTTGGDFGKLMRNQKGDLYYQSLAEQLDHTEIPFTSIWRTHIVGEKVFFQSYEALFVYENGKVETVLPQTSFHLSFKVENEFWIRQREMGLMKFEDGKLLMLPGGDIYKDIGICQILPSEGEKNKYIIFTFDQGFYSYDALSGKSSSLPLKDEIIFKNANVYGAIRLSDGQIALPTTTKGLFIINEQGGLVNHICEESGLQVNDIKQLIQDKHQNLWLALNNGMSCVYYNSPLSVFSKESGLSGNVYAIARHEGQLFVGTSTGLFVQDVNSKFLKFNWISEINKQVWNLFEAKGKLWVLTNGGLYSYDKGKVKNFNTIECRAGYYDEELSLLFIGGTHGLVYYKMEDEPELQAFLDDVLIEVAAIARNYSSNAYFELWLGSNYQGVIKLEFDKDMSHITTEYSANDGLSPGSVLPFNVNRHVVFATNSGLLSFVDEETVKKSLPDSLKNRPEFYRGFFELAKIPGNSDKKAVTLISTIQKTPFLVYDNLIHALKKDKIVYRPFLGIDIGKVNAIYDTDSIIWIGGDEALARFDLNYLDQSFNNFNIRIRKVSSDDTLISGGNSGIEKEKGRKKGEALKLKYSKGRITFDFAGLFYDQPKKTLYSFFLQGYDKKWSPWSAAHSVQYTNLKEGDYIFKVKAKNVYGQVSDTDSFGFEILPPWYRTFWAFIIYILLSGLVVYLIVILSQKRLKQQNEKLERIVAQRTEEIRLERDKNEQLLLNTLPLKVVNDLKTYGKTEPEKFENVTVYFSDVAGFTNLSTGLDPAFLISELNEIFTAFDDIMQSYNCERIKTIGDAYLAVCGMPQKDENHYEKMLKAAMDIIRYLEERNKMHKLQWRIRVGINSGSVVGGIVGVKKYIYDVFGDTINTASRMESNSEPMRINVSEATYIIAKEKFRFTKRLPLEVKGKGVMQMYFLETD